MATPFPPRICWAFLPCLHATFFPSNYSPVERGGGKRTEEEEEEEEAPGSVRRTPPTPPPPPPRAADIRKKVF